MSEEIKGTQLPFDNRKQLAVLGHLLTNPKFFEQAKHRIRPEWFNDFNAKNAYALMLKHYEIYQSPPTSVELTTTQLFTTVSEEDVPGIKGIIAKAITETGNIGLDVVRHELTEWLHAHIYQEGVQKSVALYNSGKFNECYRIVADRVAQIRDTTFDEDNEFSFEHPVLWDAEGRVAGGYLRSQEDSYKDSISTGFELLDAALRPEGTTGGGLFRGDMTVLLAPSNVGKTSFMITVIAHAIAAGQSVLFMSHEGRPSDLREKVLQSLLSVTKPQLFALPYTQEGLDRLTFAIEACKRGLTYIPYNRAGMNVEEVVPIIRRKQEQRVATNNGKGYDLLVSDYPAKLSTEKAKGGMPKRNIDEVVYDYYVQLPLEFNFHSLVAIQTNRQGSIANRDESRLLTMEDVLESWGVMTAATNVLSLNRDVQAALKNRLTTYVCKSRSSATGTAVVSNTRYSQCITHSNDLGGTCYQGTQTMSDKIDALLQQYNNVAIPTQVLK